jgi:hypothetical protein
MRERKLLREEFIGFEANDVAEETESLLDRIDSGRIIPLGVSVRRGASVRLLIVCEAYSHSESKM